MTKKISIFGVTGSIGQQTQDLILKSREDYEVEVVTGAANIAGIAQAARALNAKRAVTSDPTKTDSLKEALLGSKTEVSAGREALLEAASLPSDWAICAIVGFAGLEVSLNLAQSSRVLALANKESLVCAGALLKETCKKHATRLLPVDSEHSALFQAMGNEKRHAIDRLILTASGGPFLHKTRAEMANVTPKDAANHPNWSMGLRISIDSATLFNKALELIEAKELFDASADQLEAIIHPQSIIHAIVGFCDGSMLAHLGPPDMRGAIGYALHYPKRLPLPLEKLDFAKIGALEFKAPDHTRFPALKLADYVIRNGGVSGTVLNGAKEQAMDLFLEGQIGFLDMASLVEKALFSPSYRSLFHSDRLDDIKGADAWARDFVRREAKASQTGES